MKECWLFLKAKTNKNTVKHNKKSKPVGFKGGVTILYVYIYICEYEAANGIYFAW